MKWDAGELFPITMGRKVKKVNRASYVTKKWVKQVPVQYARLVQQFDLEDRHGFEDTGHESRRRMAYARHVLNEFGKELEYFRGGEGEFRSKVLTPILQRQLRGVPDCHTPDIDHYISESGEEVTIGEATRFYLLIDPLDPVCIPTYRRNLIYIREARWHLAILAKVCDWVSREQYNSTIDNDDYIICGLEAGEGGSGGIPPFNANEVAVIFAEELDGFFRNELNAVVRNPSHPDQWLLTTYSYSLSMLRLL